jgi:DNA polymerase delta subunit 2
MQSITSYPSHLSSSKSSAASDISDSTPRPRLHVNSTANPLDTGFQVKNKHFEQQFAAIYYARLNKLRKTVLERAEAAVKANSKYSQLKPITCNKIVDIDNEQYNIIAGTLYKEMKLKPSILDEYNQTKEEDSLSITNQSFKKDLQNYCSEDDSLIVEDEFGRVALLLNQDSLTLNPTANSSQNSHVAMDVEHIKISGLCSGITVAVLGREDIKGKFNVIALFFPDLAPQVPRPLTNSQSSAPNYILMLSGLNIGSPATDSLNQQLLLDYITGYVGSNQEINFTATISRVILAGNSLYRPAKVEKTYYSSDDNNLSNMNEAKINLKDFDLFLTELSSSVAVDVLPGESDPSNFTLPQQSIHPCIFPSASTFSNFRSLTNPAFISTEGIQLLGISGQNINDLLRYTMGKSSVELLEDCMRYRNIAPTAPDTLPCYPFQTNDPFVLQNTPNIVFVGNQPRFETKLCTGDNGEIVRLICLPSFSVSGIAVLCDINSKHFDVQPVQFGGGAMQTAADL